jgi:citrate lyase subunit beta / citryl-CoA lyase
VTERLRRSELSTPGTSEKMLEKAAASAADLVFCDLEDSVAPAHKESARKIVVDALTGRDWGTKTRAVRVNGVHTEWWKADIEAVVAGARGSLDLLIVPKVRTIEDVDAVDGLLDILDSDVALEVLIEEAEGLVNVEEIARSSSRLEALIFGPGDFSASQGVRWGLAHQAEYPGDIWGYHRSRIVVAARAAGIEAIDGPFANFRDLKGYRQECRRAALIGYTGKWAIHPDQIAIANDVFSPTESEVQAARELVDAYAKAEAEGEGAAGVGGVMIDAATVRIMEGVLHRAEAIRLLSSRLPKG